MKNVFSDFALDTMKKNGFNTPEEARDFVVEEFKKANISEANLVAYTKPIDELSFFELDVIFSLAHRKNEVKDWVKKNGDFSDQSNFMNFEWYINP